MKIFTTLILSFTSLVFLALGILRSNGYVGATEKNGGAGCNCHSFSPSTQVSAGVIGPDSFFVGSTVNYKLFVTGGPRVSAGFNLAARTGRLGSVDNFTKLIQFVPGDSQLTHTSPRAFSSDTLFWNFRYTAPNSVGLDTIYSVVNSTNGNGQADGNDKWNFGRKFVVKIHNNPVSVENGNMIADNFILYQNYPNPFNPSTKIRWYSPTSEINQLKIYDINGKELVTLIDEFRQAGLHEVEFNLANSLLNKSNKFSVSSGVYFYKLTIGNYSEVKKMILIK